MKGTGTTTGITTGAAEVELQAEGGGRHTGVAADEAVHVVSGGTGAEDAEVDGQAHALAEAEHIEEADTGGEFLVTLEGELAVVLAHDQKAGGGVRNEAPEASLLVAVDAVGEVPEEVAVEIVVGSLVELAALGGVEEAMPAGTDTDGGAEPLAEVQVRGKTDLAHAELLLDDGVHAGAEADERVVESAVGHIGTTDHLTVRIAVAVLLRHGVEGEEEACSSKDSDEFDDFHNVMLV